MSAEEWERIKAIFGAACVLPDQERAEFVRSACGGNELMAATVFDLLENHRESSNQIIRPFSAAVRPVFECGELIAGRFRVISFVARGGMGEVYEVWDERLRQTVALKTLRQELASDAEALERFQREIRLARHVMHQSLCRVYDLVEHRRTDPAHPGRECVISCLTMEYLKGESLGELLQKQRPLPLPQAADLAAQIAGALQLLHDHGIIHRDLKPSNIMLVPSPSGDYRAVVTDFGLAKGGDGDRNLFDTRTDLQAGAPFFMAPELLRGAPPTVASDVYALGLILDEMVTASPAFSAASLPGLLYAKLYEEAVSPAERSQGLPDNWRTAIERCLSRDPAERPQNVHDVLSIVGPTWVSPGPAARPEEWAKAQTPGKRRTVFQRMRRPVVLALGLIGVGMGVTTARIAMTSVNTQIEVFDIENQAGKDHNYVAKGTTLEVMQLLSGLQTVRVVPRHAPRTSASSRGSARFALDGLLQQDQKRLRMSLQVIDNETGSLVWAQKYDASDRDDRLSLQSRIAADVVGALRDRLLFGRSDQNSVLPVAVIQFGRLLARPLLQSVGSSATQNSAALDLYMRARHTLEDMSSESTRTAVGLLQQAVTEDPTFSLGWALLARTYIAQTDFHDAPQAELLERAREAAAAALRYGPNFSESHFADAAVRQIDADWEGAEASYREALRLRPTFAAARRWYAHLNIQRGKFEEGLAEARRAISDDPYDRSSPTALGWYLFLANRNEEAVEVLSRAAGDRAVPGTRLNLCQVYARLGYSTLGEQRRTWFAKAIAEAERVARFENDQLGPYDAASKHARVSDQMFALAYSSAGDRERARPHLDRLINAMNSGTLSPAVVAWVHALQGDKDQAISTLERAFPHRDRKLLESKVIPYFAGLRGVPRYEALLHQMRL